MKKIGKRILGLILVFLMSLTCLCNTNVYAGIGGTIYPSRTGYYFFTLDGATYRVDLSIGTEQVNTHYLVSESVTLQSGNGIVTGYVPQVWTETDENEFIYPDIYSPGDREYRMKTTIYYSKPGYHLDATSSNCCQSVIESVTETSATFYISTNDCGITNWYDGTLAFYHNTLNIALAPNTYTVRYNGNGNTGGSTANSTHTYDTNGNLSANGFTKTGYTFAGWSTSPNGGVVYSNQQSVRNLSQTNGAVIDLYAVWIPNYYTLYVNPNGGQYNGSTGVSTMSPNLIFNTSNWCNIGTNCSRTGYTLNGYYTANSGGTKVYNTNGTCVNNNGYWSNNSYVYPNNLTVYAQWTPNNYSENFDANGGYYPYSRLITTYDSMNYYAVGCATRPHYTFNGWYTARSGGVQVYASNGYCTNEGTYWYNNRWHYAGDVSLYAQWSLAQCVTSFDSQGGSSVPSRTDNITSKYNNLVIPTRPGWDFQGWYTQPNGAGSRVDNGTDIPDVEYTTLYANWSVHVSDVTVNCTVNQSNVIYAKGSPVYLVKLESTDVSGAHKTYIKAIKWNSTDSDTKSITMKVNSGTYITSVIGVNEFSIPTSQSVDVSQGNNSTISFSKDEIDYSKYTGNDISVKGLK